jgi:hypothetical protein
MPIINAFKHVAHEGGIWETTEGGLKYFNQNNPNLKTKKFT